MKESPSHKRGFFKIVFRKLYGKNRQDDHHHAPGEPLCRIPEYFGGQVRADQFTNKAKDQ